VIQASSPVTGGITAYPFAELYPVRQRRSAAKVRSLSHGSRPWSAQVSSDGGEPVYRYVAAVDKFILIDIFV
jgi:hypothetical protein